MSTNGIRVDIRPSKKASDSFNFLDMNKENLTTENIFENMKYIDRGNRKKSNTFQEIEVKEKLTSSRVSEGNNTSNASSQSRVPNPVLEISPNNNKYGNQNQNQNEMFPSHHILPPQPNNNNNNNISARILNNHINTNVSSNNSTRSCPSDVCKRVAKVPISSNLNDSVMNAMNQNQNLNNEDVFQQRKLVKRHAVMFDVKNNRKNANYHLSGRSEVLEGNENGDG